MINTTLSNLYNLIKEYLVYAPPDTPKPFVLEENTPDRKPDKGINTALANSISELEKLLRYGRRLETLNSNLLLALKNRDLPEKLDTLKNELRIFEKQRLEIEPIGLSYDSNLEKPSTLLVSASLDENEKTVYDLYDLSLNKDIVIRKITVSTSQPLKAMLVLLILLLQDRSV